MCSRLLFAAKYLRKMEDVRCKMDDVRWKMSENQEGLVFDSNHEFK